MSGEIERPVESRDVAAAGAAASGVEIPHMFCGGYRLFMSDGSPFLRQDIARVTMNLALIETSSSRSYLTAHTRPCLKRKCQSSDEEDGALDERDTYRPVSFGDEDDEEGGSFDPHICGDEAESSIVSNKCNMWCNLTDAQKAALASIEERVEKDCTDGRNFTCAILEGPGGCGKTRVLSHIMNHKKINSLVLYVTKQNKRVQEFVHIDCLKGELNSNVQKPIDLSSSKIGDISLLLRGQAVGRFALTAEKLVSQIAHLFPDAFRPDTSVRRLRIDYNIFGCKRQQQQQRHSNEPNGTCSRSNAGAAVGARNVIILLDEYTMQQTPLIHALAYHVMSLTKSPLVLILAGDKQQFGPVGWDTPDLGEFSNDIRQEFVTKMKYEPLELKLENLQRCQGDPALADCIKRLRRLSEESTSAHVSRKKVMNLVLAKYSVDSGVNLYRHQVANGESVILKVVPSNMAKLDFGGADNEGESYAIEEEEYDETGVEFDTTTIVPEYDLLPSVNYVTALYVQLAKLTFGQPETLLLVQQTGDVIRNAAADIRHTLPAFLVVANEMCNKVAELFLLGLYMQVRSRLLETPMPKTLHDRNISKEDWSAHLECILNKHVRCLVIDEKEAIRRQTLFVGMVYRMTSTINAASGGYSLCNGEKVVLTAIIYNKDNAQETNGIVVRKLDIDVETDYMLRPGFNQNRKSNQKPGLVFPLVPYVTENFYQMQGCTMSARANSFIDLVNASCTNAYVAVSRFQNSRSIQGIVIAD